MLTRLLLTMPTYSSSLGHRNVSLQSISKPCPRWSDKSSSIPQGKVKGSSFIRRETYRSQASQHLSRSPVEGQIVPGMQENIRSSQCLSSEELRRSCGPPERRAAAESHPEYRLPWGNDELRCGATLSKHTSSWRREACLQCAQSPSTSQEGR